MRPSAYQKTWATGIRWFLFEELVWKAYHVHSGQRLVFSGEHAGTW